MKEESKKELNTWNSLGVKINSLVFLEIEVIKLEDTLLCGNVDSLDEKVEVLEYHSLHTLLVNAPNWVYKLKDKLCERIMFIEFLLYDTYNMEINNFEDFLKLSRNEDICCEEKQKGEKYLILVDSLNDLKKIDKQLINLIERITGEDENNEFGSSLSFNNFSDVLINLPIWIESFMVNIYGRLDQLRNLLFKVE